jgi:glutathione synthase/RimK-type ligase-like ATP-grasp enzyme
MCEFDITLLTSKDYLTAKPGDLFTEELLQDDWLLARALEKRGLKVTRTNWDNPDFDWTNTRYVIFRTPWDYFSRFSEFSPWLERTSKITKFINPVDVIMWNIDKHYMLDLEKAGITIPPTVFIEPGDKRLLKEIADSAGWDEFILKPAISGGAWHTYRLNHNNITLHEEIYKTLIVDKSMLLQQYQNNITGTGEVSFMVFGGRYSHAVLKKATEGDFRVQANCGGTVHDYSPTKEEVKFAEDVVVKSNYSLAYARVDLMRDNNNKICLCELEVFEPELWFRKHPQASERYADIILGEITV